MSNVQVKTAQIPGRNRGFRFPMRRRAVKMSDAERACELTAARSMVDDFIARRGVTVCPPGFAVGSRPSQYEF